MNQKEITENLTLAQTLLEQWLRFRQYYLKGISEEPISPEEETQFLETTSTVAQNVRKLAQRVDEKQHPFKAKEISALLKGSISIANFRNLPETDQKAFYKQWHECQVYLSRTVGAFKFLHEGYRPPVKKGAKKKSGGGNMKMIMIIVIAILVAAGGYYVWQEVI